MKATINELWDTGRQILSYENSETDRPQDFADLKKCKNVTIGQALGSPKVREITVNGMDLICEEIVTRHPQGGKMYILEVY